MVRTQIYLPEAVHQRLTRIAKQKKLSMAFLIRKFIEGGLFKDSGEDVSGKKTMNKIAAMNILGGPKDLSAHLDKYLYG